MESGFAGSAHSAPVSSSSPGILPSAQAGTSSGGGGVEGGTGTISSPYIARARAMISLIA
jgi:hypothetical protein